MTHQLDFTHLHSYSSHDAVIAVPIALRSDDKVVDLIASLDTGASHCLFERGYADRLGLDPATGIRTTFRTANSSFDAFGHHVEIDALGIVTHSLVYFFADDSIVRNVLGRRGWLDRIRLGLVDYDRALYLAEYNAR